jgi:hypothetical protein
MGCNFPGRMCFALGVGGPPALFFLLPMCFALDSMSLGRPDGGETRMDTGFAKGFGRALLTLLCASA